VAPGIGKLVSRGFERISRPLLSLLRLILQVADSVHFETIGECCWPLDIAPGDFACFGHCAGY